MQQRVSHGYFLEDLEVGMTATHAKRIASEDILGFAELCGDFNPVHIDDAYAAGTMFKERIAHGMLSASLISTVFGMKLPGPGAIYVSQTLNFKAPVKIGDEVVARVECASVVEAKARVIFDCVCTVGDRRVLVGEAVLMVPRRNG